MKKTLAIGLLFIYLFHLAGYSFVFRVLMNQSDARMVQAIDAEAYDKGDVMILKTPVHLPYYNGSTGFERVEGEVELAGTHYTYVQRKISNDTLYLVCLLNKEKTALSKTKNNAAKEAASLPADNKKGAAPNGKIKDSGSDYSQALLHYSFTALCRLAGQNTPSGLQQLSSGVLSTPYAPPDFI